MDSQRNMPDPDDHADVFGELIARISLSQNKAGKDRNKAAVHEVCIDIVLGLANDLNLDIEEVRRNSLDHLSDYVDDKGEECGNELADFIKQQ